jgi:serpin B
MTKLFHVFRTSFFLTLSLLIIFSGCSRKAQKGIQSRTAAETQAIFDNPMPQRSNFFAFDLMRTLPFERDNLVFSPFSISAALAMTYAGAREQTMEEMSATLFFDTDQEAFHPAYGQYLAHLQEMAGDSIRLNIANRLWAQQGYHFLPDFFELIETHYGSSVREVDFRGPREPIRLDINEWVYNQTGENIPDLIGQGALTEDTRLVLVNAIHFFGRWMAEFDKEATRRDLFNNLDGSGSTADFMMREGQYPYYETERLQALEIPYQDGNFSMVVVLPSEDATLEDFELNFGPPGFFEVVQGLGQEKVLVSLPRFRAETGFNLEEVLSEMGMPRAFSNRAEFSGMTGDDTLKIDKVIHKAMIDVQEGGTEAAAATAVVMVQKTSIDMEEPKVFKADRPFLFFLKENEYNSILFMGRVVGL